MTEQIEELKMIGRSYLNASSYLKYVARNNVLNQEAVDKHNRALRKAQKVEETVESLETELEKLQQLLVVAKSKSQK